MAEEGEQLTRLLDRNADRVNQVRQQDVDFDPVFATRQNAGDGRRRLPGGSINPIADQRRPPVFQMPHRTFRLQRTVFLGDALGYNVDPAANLFEFHLGGFATRFRFSLRSLPPFSSSFFLGLKRIMLGILFRRRLRRLPVFLGLMRCEPLPQLLVFFLQSFDASSLLFEQIEQAIDRLPKVTSGCRFEFRP
jgi:hypothetical protein